MNTEYYIENSSLGFDGVGRILRRRKKWVLAGLAIGLVIALAVILLVPKQYTARAHVHVLPRGASLSLSGSDADVNMATERELAKSADTADAAAAALGGQWNRDHLLENVTVGGDSDSTIMRISFTDSSTLEAIAGAMAMAEAYLQVGSDAETARQQNMLEGIDRRISEQAGAIDQIVRMNEFITPAQQADIDTRRELISDLQQQKLSLDGVSGPTGQIVTPADARTVYSNPSTLRTLGLGLLGGLALGVALALLAQAMTRRPADSYEVEQLLGVPVWGPVAPEGDDNRWALTHEFAQHVTKDKEDIVLLYDEEHSASVEAASFLSESLDAKEEEINEKWAGSLRSAIQADAVIAIVSLEWSKDTLYRLAHDLDQVGASLVGAVVADAPAESLVV